jgi:hypothetical protein
MENGKKCYVVHLRRSLDERYSVTVEGPSDATADELSKLIIADENEWGNEDDEYLKVCTVSLVGQEAVDDHKVRVDCQVVRNEDGDLELW